MGIRGLNNLINQYAKEAIQKKHISEFCNKKVAIDSEILIYKFRAVVDSHTSPNAHIHGFINNIFWFLRNGIIPVYVFDGPPNEAKKNNVLVKRSNIKERQEKKIVELEHQFVQQVESLENPETSKELNETIDELLKAQRRIVSTKGHRQECKYLLKLMGIPYINSMEDGEALCVELLFNGEVDYVMSEDTDTLVYAAARLSRDPSKNVNIIKKIPNSDEVTVVNVKKVVELMGLTYNSFVDMCIVSGCDFCGNIRNIAQTRSYHLIAKHKCIEEIIKNNPNMQFDNFNYQEARDIFYKENIKRDEKSLELGTLDVHNLKEYLTKERNITNPTFIIDKYNYACIAYKNRIQSLGNWPRAIDAVATDAVASAVATDAVATGAVASAVATGAVATVAVASDAVASDAVASAVAVASETNI